MARGIIVRMTALLALLLFGSLQAQVHQAVAKRAVILEFSLLDDALALGLRPVGMADSQLTEGSNPPYLQHSIKGISSVGTRQQPSLQAIADLKPDLIIADTTFQQHLLEPLSRIAPVLMLNGLQAMPEQQMANLDVIAQHAGLTSAQRARVLAHALRQQWQQAVKLGNQHKASVLIGYVAGDGLFYALTRNAMASHYLAAWGKQNLVSAFRRDQSTPLALEQVLALNPDSLIVLLTDGQRAALDRLKTHPLWLQLRAVKQHHVYTMDRDIWAKTHGVMALKIMLNDALKSGFLAQRAGARG